MGGSKLLRVLVALSLLIFMGVTAESMAAATATTATESTATTTATTATESTATTTATTATESTAITTASTATGSTATTTASTETGSTATTTATTMTGSTATTTASTETGSTGTTTASTETGSTATTTTSTETGSTATTTASTETGSTATTTASTETGSTATTTATNETQGSTTPGANGTEDTSMTTPASPTTPAAITACNADLCGIATCVDLHETFRCQCPVYLYYINGSCTAGDSVFGNLVLNNQAFSQGNVEEYTVIYQDVERHFQQIFANDTNYAQTVIQDISTQTSRSRTARNGVTVSVRTIVMFQLNSIDPEQVVNMATQYFKDEGIGSFAEKNVCDGFYCDTETTTCDVTAGQPLCKCIEGTYTSAEAITSCRECDPSCGSVEGQRCVLDSEKRLPKCVCGPGYNTTGDNKCTKCSFGYTGQECKDNFQLLLVIIGSVAGALLIALIGTIIGCSIRSRKREKSSDRNKLLLDDGFSGSSSPQPNRLFPKVKADLGQVNKSANIYDDDEQFTRSMPKRDYEEDPWYEMSHRDRKY